VGVSQTLRRWTEGATYIWQSGHHAGIDPRWIFDIQGGMAENIAGA